MPPPDPPDRLARLNRALLADPVQRYSAGLYKGFVQYVRWYVRRHFHAVLVSCATLPCVPAGTPLIIYSNHPSWWDPLLFALVGQSLFAGRRGYGPMEAHALKQYPILERLGAFGVEPGSSQGGVAFMIQARRILADPASILWLTVEGAFTDVRLRPVRIQQGISYLVRLSPGVIVMPMAIEYPFWNESRPEALCRFGAPIHIDVASRPLRTAAQWTAHFEQALAQTMEQLALESMQRSTASFRSLLAGSTGVGGIYDAWRRLRAWTRGRRFKASHGQQE